MQSTTSSSSSFTGSTASLMPKYSSSSQPTKNWESAFGSLSSSFGFGGGVPSLPHKKASSKTKATPTSSRQQVAVMQPQHNAYPSTTKNWEAAFGDLSSSYGFGGSVPSVPPKVVKAPKTPQFQPLYAPSSNSTTSSSSKNYEEAFGQLQSSYGFGGPVPITTSKHSR